MRRKRRIKRKIKNILSVITLLILITILIFSLFEIYSWFKDNDNINDINKDINSLTEITENDEEGDLANPPDDKSDDYWDFIKVPFLEVSFDKLLKRNSDTVGFIHLDSTNINYPIVQTKDNDYYLNHAFDKSKNEAGWVFMDYRNDSKSLDFNTIIYGHGRVNKTVFGSLKNTLNKSFWTNKDNQVIRVSTPTFNYVFQIFSIYTIDDETYYIKTNFNSNNQKKKWLKTMKERNISTFDTKVDINDKIITLSTCENNNGGRIVVQAKLIKSQKR